MQSQLCQMIAELVAIPSISDRREECHRALDWVQAGLGQGLYLTPFEYGGYRSLIASAHPGKRARLILNAHLDVVFADPHQFQLKESEGLLWGRGAYDMKGAAVVLMQVARDVAALPEDERPDVQFQFVTDEEIGGHRGSERLAAEGYTGELFIAAEPTDLGICHQAKGVFWITVHLQGTPGHGARPWLCHNPLLDLQTGLARLQQRYPNPPQEVWRTTATPTGIVAGNSHNRVPDQVALKLDIRHLPEESPDDIQPFVEECFPGCRIEVVQRSYSLKTDPDHPLVRQVATIQAEVTGQAPRFFSEHFASDARYWSNLGVPAICWGPSGGGMHADDERLDSASVELFYRLVHRLLREY